MSKALLLRAIAFLVVCAIATSYYIYTTNVGTTWDLEDLKLILSSILLIVLFGIVGNFIWHWLSRDEYRLVDAHNGCYPEPLSPEDLDQLLALERISWHMLDRVSVSIVHLQKQLIHAYEPSIRLRIFDDLASDAIHSPSIAIRICLKHFLAEMRRGDTCFTDAEDRDYPWSDIEAQRFVYYLFVYSYLKGVSYQVTDKYLEFPWYREMVNCLVCRGTAIRFHQNEMSSSAPTLE